MNWLYLALVPLMLVGLLIVWNFGLRIYLRSGFPRLTVRRIERATGQNQPHEPPEGQVVATYQRWLLKTDDAVVGRIDVTGTDQPWFTGQFQPEPGFQEFSDLFSRELALVEGDLEQQLGQWEEVYGEYAHACAS